MKNVAAIVISLALVFSYFTGLADNLSVHSSFFSNIDSLQREAKHQDVATKLTGFIEEQLNADSINHQVLTRAYQIKGNTFRVIGQAPQSVLVFEEAINHAILAGDSIELANAHSELAHSFTIMGRYQEALEQYTKTLEIDQNLGSLMGVAMDLNAIGKIYEVWRQYDIALDFFHQSLAIARELNNESMEALRLASIGSVYKSLGQYETALEWLNNSLEIERRLENTVRIGFRLDQIGEVYTLMDSFETADTFLRQALAIFRENKVAMSESITLNHIANNKFRQGNHASAINYYNQSLSVANELGYSNILKKNHKELSFLYQEGGNYRLAFEHFKNYDSLKTLAFSEKAQQELMYFQVKYETEQREKEMAILNQEKLQKDLQINKSNQRILVMVGLSAILIILLITLLYRFHAKKKAQQKLALLNNQLNKTNQTKDKLFKILAHDLKNPIYAFRNISSAVHENINEMPKDQLSHFTHELSSSSTKLCSFLDDLLKWAASQTGQLKPEKQVFALKPMLHQIIQLHDTMIRSKKINTILDVDENHCAFADPNMINAVFRNLISNAIKFTPENGFLQIESKQDEKETLVKFKDNGVGIANEHIHKLFDISSEASSIAANNQQGTGLGLVFCKEFLEINNGTISVESTIGKGSTFIVTLPVEEESQYTQ